MAGEGKALTLKGIAASPGIAGGPVYRLEAQELQFPTHQVPPEGIPEEIAAFHRALEETGEQLETIKEQVAREVGEDKAAIFGAHQLVLQDPALVDEVENRIRQGTNGAQAIAAVVSELEEMLAQLEDEYLRERAADIRDVGNRILRNFLGVAGPSLTDFAEPVVVFARDLTPSETAQLRPDRVLAFATVTGGRTSHAAIMARSLEIPAVVGLGEELVAGLSRAREAIVDGTRGEVILDPTPADWAEYRKRKEEYQEYARRLVSLRELPAQTPDGHRVELFANIGSPADLPGVEKVNAEGIGLFRTEFLYMDRTSLPTEEEQFQAYRKWWRNCSPTGGHKIPGHWGRQGTALPGPGPGGEPLSGLAGHPLLPGPARCLQGPAGCHSQGQRLRQNQVDVPHGCQCRGSAPGPGPPG